jgi:SagB-type dehydrogenase family enzyme
MSKVRTLNAAEVLYGETFLEDPLANDPAEEYHEASKLYRSRVRRQNDAYFIESNASALISTVRSGKKWHHRPSVELPEPHLPSNALSDLLRARRSKNEFSGSALTLQHVSTLLFAAYGVTRRVSVKDGEAEQIFRTTPSGGALFPLDVYVAVHRADGLASGLYAYDSLAHCLIGASDESPTRRLAGACIYPAAVETAAITLMFVGVFWRSRFKYRLRAYRNTLFEAGHAAQNVLLTAHGLGLGAVPFSGYFDDEVDEMLGIDGVNQSCIYCLSVGTFDARLV